jgi:hypothetical protein
MKDQVTSIEQSKRLIEMGVPADKANMVWLAPIDLNEYYLTTKMGYCCPDERDIPAFTVADLLGVMPPDIPAVVGQNHDYALTLSNNFCWNLRYENSHTHQCIGEQLEFDLVDLLCNRIEWIVSNGYELNL